jgi:hypothetical protein
LRRHRRSKTMSRTSDTLWVFMYSLLLGLMIMRGYMFQFEWAHP